MEELLFRKFILERLECLGFKGSVICSAVLFALPHLISQGPAQVIYTFALGLVWAYVTLKTGKLWLAVILHSLSNVYGAFLPMSFTRINPAMPVLFVAFTMLIIVPAAIILIVREFK
ncbi:MAG: CPBP family intramembrane metalloprotease [Saccharofermentans sp.]|nr:CPBP family intramembrane metalloprotease [Saccharofermentans sp.]